MALTYNQLVQAIQDYTQVTEDTFNNNIPNFVRNTELVVNNTVQLPAFRRNVTGQATQLFQYLNLPSDFLSLFSLAVINDQNDYNYLFQKDVNYIREAYPYPTSLGEPKYYGIFSSTALILGPTPDQSYNMEMHYYAAPVSIVDAGTSWLGENYPYVLLNGSLYFAYGFLKGESDMIQYYKQAFDDTLTSLKMLGDGKDREDNYRTVQVRDQVK